MDRGAATHEGGWSMGFKVAATNPRAGYDYAYEREALDGIGAEVVPIRAEDEASYREQLGDCDALIVGIRPPVTASVIAALSRCKVIANGGIGVDKVDVDAASAAGIVVTNVPDVFTEEVADQAFTLLLAVNRKLVYCHQMATSGRWAEAYAGLGSMPKIHGKTLGLVAFGNIARAVARRATGFGLRVLAHDPFVPPEVMAEHGVEAAPLDRLFAESDFISAHAPHTKGTHHILNYDLFSRMKPTAVFVNTGRGKVVDEPGLIRALREGKLAGAGLDVLEDEPPAPDNPLLSMENVVVTPHMASYSNESNVERRRRVGQEIAAVLTGRRPRGVVNPAVLDRLALA
jgi:D-3-phosphoglycerate dehydrogenase / 2-oxoglutarate reductase